jgi:Uncharacterized protein conserved in bacteria (DUF2188)
MVRRFSVSPPAQKVYRVLDGGPPGSANTSARRALDKAKASRAPAAVHVTKRDGGWAVKTAGRERAMVVKPSKAAAVAAANATAAKRGARVVEHARDGKIQDVRKPRHE